MSSRIECPGCSSQLVVHDKLLGRLIRCPKCGGEMQLPSRNELVSVQRAARRDRAVQQRSRNAGEAPPGTLTRGNAVVAAPPPIEPAKAPRKRHERKPHESEEEDLEWDVTPMVDVSFLLLIFFMLTASFSVQKVIPSSAERSDKPSSNAVSVEEDADVPTVIVEVDEQDNYEVIFEDGTTKSTKTRAQLIDLLKSARDPLGPVIAKLHVKAHEESSHGGVVTALDAGKEANFSRFQVSTEEELE